MRSIRGQSLRDGAIAAAAGAKGICGNRAEVLSCSGRFELSCSAKESTRVLCFARSIEGGVFVLADLRVYGDFSTREPCVGDLSRDTRPEIFGASMETDKSVILIFAGGDGLTVNSPRRGSDKSSGEKRRVRRAGQPMIKFLIGTSV